MSLLLLYIVKVIACAGILYGYYFFFLRNKLFHHYNRFYLLSAMVLSLLLPLLHIPVGNAADEPGIMYRAVQAMEVIHEPVAEADEAGVATGSDAASNFFTALFTTANATYFGYLAGLLVAVILLLRSFWYVRKLSRKYSPEWIGRIRFFMTAEPGTPFSFFRSVFWNDQLPVDSPEGRQVFLHEYYHVQQRHSIDIVLAEAIIALAWFNPFFYFIKKELKAIHEFLADQYASDEHNKYEYAQLLVERAIATKKARLTHSFFQPQIKRRIAMIMRTNQIRYNYWSRLMALPVLAVIFFMLVLRTQPTQAAAPEQNTNIPNEQTIFLPETELTDAAQPTERPKQKPSSVKITNEEKELNLEKVRMLKRNATTTKDLEELFGTPLTRENGDKTELWLYRGERSNLYVEVNKMESKMVHFDYQQQFLSAQPTLSFEKAEKLHQHETTLAEVKKLFGDPNHLALTPTMEFWLYEQPSRRLEVEFLRTKDEPQKVWHHNYTEAMKTEPVERRRSTATGKIDSIPVEISWQYNKTVQLRHSNLPPPQLHNDRIDSLVTTIMRHYNRNLRYPALENPQPPEGSIYFSVKIDGSNILQDLQLYDNAPATNGAKIHDIVVVGFAKSITDSSKVISFSRAMLHELFGREVKRVTQVPLKTAPVADVPAPFYVKVTFKLERESKTAFEIKGERKKGRIFIRY